MDNNKLVIGLIVAVAAFLGAPIALRALRPAPPATAEAPPAQNSPNPTPVTPAPNNPLASAQQQAQQWQQPQMAPQGLNAQTLAGTLWEVRAPQGTVQFQFNAGGQGLAIHPLAGQIPARWTCAGNSVTVTASAYGQTISVFAMIQGNNLVGQGCSIRRLR